MTRRGLAYDDVKNIFEAKRIQQAYLAQDGRKHDGAVSLKIETFATLPKGRKYDEPNVHKPDADNIAKAIMDALNGLAYDDDRQVTRLSVIKHKRTRHLHDSLTFSVADDEKT